MQQCIRGSMGEGRLGITSLFSLFSSPAQARYAFCIAFCHLSLTASPRYAPRYAGLSCCFSGVSADAGASNASNWIGIRCDAAWRVFLVFPAASVLRFLLSICVLRHCREARRVIFHRLFLSSSSFSDIHACFALDRSLSAGLGSGAMSPNRESGTLVLHILPHVSMLSKLSMHPSLVLASRILFASFSVSFCGIVRSSGMQDARATGRKRGEEGGVAARGSVAARLAVVSFCPGAAMIR